MMLSSEDERRVAQRRLPRDLFEYVDGGAGAETTLKRNLEDLSRIELCPRVMQDVSSVNPSIEILGQNLSMPVVLGPIGFAGMLARRGEAQAARAAEAAGVAFTLATPSICSIEEVRGALRGAPWFQLYMLRDREFMAKLLDRAAAEGAPILVLTVDLPIAGVRYRDLRSGFAATSSPFLQIRSRIDAIMKPAWIWDVYLRGRPHHFGNLINAVPEKQRGDFTGWIRRNFDPSATWAEVEWIRRRWRGGLLIKGIMSPTDARSAFDAGADGLIVSNHGGRQLDGASSTAHALPAVVSAVGHVGPIFIDGGVRTGTDVLRAFTLGASGVFLGRAWAYALAARGERGVAGMLERMRTELMTAMALTGRGRLASEIADQRLTTLSV